MSKQPPESPIDAQLASPPFCASSDQSPTPPPQQPKNSAKLLQSRFAVLGILFGVTGCLGIPLLWMNKQFSQSERVMWAVIVSLYTALLCYGTYRICAWSYGVVFG